MRRREFLGVMGGAATGLPRAARAQQADRMRRIGVLTNLSESDSEGRARDEAFVQGLRQLGWTEGTNLQIDRRFTGGDLTQLAADASQAAAVQGDRHRE